MAALQINQSDIPRLDGKTAIITGAASGIGFAAAKILSAQGATVHVLDIKSRDESELPTQLPPELATLHYHQCNIASWVELRAAFESIGQIDIAIANAGVSEEQHSSYFDDIVDADGKLVQPTWGVLDVNYRAVLDFVKLAWSNMRRHHTEGSIVITASTSSYMTEQALPVYSSGKAALIGLVRALRSKIIKDNITINAVAPSGTLTPSMAPELYEPMIRQGVVMSTPDVVGLALVYSATARENRMVDLYGKDKQSDLWTEGRWNGRCILTLGDTYTEIEEPTADLKPFWFGRDNVRLTRLQQAATDFR
ncbi:NAD(P)-binding protein [Biscogniauxia marginata]|nr:NAD(P)-binding protein [Biscogniauxia marginata]